jgi:GntR family transcriptional regulator/MocR family aminotransferase
MRRVRRAYLARRDALASALSHHLDGALEFELPEGGTAIWTRAAPDIDVAAWAEAGRREGVLFADSRRYDFHERDTTHVRLGFSYHDESELCEAVRRMARALMRVRAPRLRPSPPVSLDRGFQRNPLPRGAQAATALRSS